MPVGERSSPVVDLQSAGCPTVTPRYILLVTVHLPQLHVPGSGTVFLTMMSRLPHLY